MTDASELIPSETSAPADLEQCYGPGSRTNASRHRVRNAPVLGKETLWSWKGVAYAIVLGLSCLLLVPLTDLWWIVPLVGAAAPVALIATAHLSRGHEGLGQRAELLAAVATHGLLTPLDAARLTSCTAVEAAHLMDVLASEGALTRITEGGSEPIAPAASLPLPASMQRQEVATAALPPPAPIACAPFALTEPLTERELEVLTLLADGRTNSEAARALFISVGTVKSHTGNIYRKLGAKNRTEAIARARQAGLIS
jgi:DNA-binding CsgD family transcriptional regulator